MQPINVMTSKQLMLETSNYLFSGVRELFLEKLELHWEMPVSESVSEDGVEWRRSL